MVTTCNGPRFSPVRKRFKTMSTFCIHAVLIWTIIYFIRSLLDLIPILSLYLWDASILWPCSVQFFNLNYDASIRLCPILLNLFSLYWDVTTLCPPTLQLLHFIVVNLNTNDGRPSSPPDLFIMHLPAIYNVCSNKLTNKVQRLGPTWSVT